MGSKQRTTGKQADSGKARWRDSTGESQKYHSSSSAGSFTNKHGATSISNRMASTMHPCHEDAKERLRKAREVADAIEAGREPWKGVWREVEEYILPRTISYGAVSGDYGATRPDQKQGKRIIDGLLSVLRFLAAGMQGANFSARPWFRLRLESKMGQNLAPERRWLDKVPAVIYALARSNFYSVVHSLYTELAAFGSANMYLKWIQSALCVF